MWPSTTAPRQLVAVATSSEETLLLTRTGEVLVCRHVDVRNADNDYDEKMMPSVVDEIENDNAMTTKSPLDNCSLNANSFEVSVTSSQHKQRSQQQSQQQPQRHSSLQKAFVECCEPERFCDLSTNDHGHRSSNSTGRGGTGLFGGSEEGHQDYDFLMNVTNVSKLSINNTDNHHEIDDGADNADNNDDWNTVSTRRRKQSQQQLSVLHTPPRNNVRNQRRVNNDTSSSTPSSTINNVGSSDSNNEKEADEHDYGENSDVININDVQLQDHDKFTFIGESGGGSPTPMLSFDYSGYEPPTPERLIGSTTMHDDEYNYEDDAQTGEGNGSVRTDGFDATFSMAGPVPPPLPSTFPTTYAMSLHEEREDSVNGRNVIKGHHQLEKRTNNKQQQQRRVANTTPQMLCGIPTFLHHLSQIRITHLSAHPRGHHVLLISDEGLLFSYGSNECGQLGLGRFHKTRGEGGTVGNNRVDTDSTQFRVTIPSIVTPLLENGGKTINCAAGVDYSLVVVRTEGSRLSHQRKQQYSGSKLSPLSSSPGNSPNDRNAHHQMYGFGNNEHMKLGLLDPDCNGARRNNSNSGNYTTPRRSRGGNNTDASSPSSSTLSWCFSTPDSFATDDSGIVENGQKQDTDNYVFLPRRVALYCRVISRKETNPTMNQTQSDINPLEYGIFNVAASFDHSAALVRRPNGAVELYTWGRGDAVRQDALRGASPEFSIPSPRRWECVPILKPAKKETQNGKIIATPTLVTSLSSLHDVSGAPPRSPRKESQRRSPKTLPNPENREEPKSLLNPFEYLVDLSLGPACTHVVTSIGRWFAFGSSDDGLLGLGSNISTSLVPAEVKLASPETIQTVSIGEKHAVAISSQGRAYTWGRYRHGIAPNSEKSVSSPRPIPFSTTMPSKTNTLENALMRHIGLEASNTTGNAFSDVSDGVVYAHAGRDLSVFIVESGAVLSCGKKSGRLGQGNISMDVNSPRQMFGGLQLWRNG